LKGVLGKRGGRVWCFCGVFVVEGVVKDGELMASFSLLKKCHNFQLYFLRCSI
jgi:hypothetical protein